MKLVVSGLLVLALSIASAPCAESAAQRLLEQSGLSGGIVAVPRVSDASLALELADHPGWIVYAQSDNADTVHALRTRAAEKGLLARSLYVGHGTPDRLGLADQSVSLLLITDLTAKDLTAANRSECLRVLAPRRGVAIVGNADANRIPVDALRTWAAKLDRAKVAADSHGRWLTFQRPPREGADEWPMRYHDPANQRISGDKTLQPPFLAQWYALPVHQSYWGSTMVCSGGRSYLISSMKNFRAKTALIASDIGSGMKLWERELRWEKPRDKFDAGYYPGRSCLVAHEELLYMVDDDDIAVIEGETGRDLSRIPGPQPDGQIKWLTRADKLLAVLAGEADKYQAGSLQSLALNPYGRVLAVYNEDGTRLWQESEEGPIDEHEIAAHAGRLFYHAKDVRVACRDLRSGKLVWENSDPEVLKLLQQPTKVKRVLLTSLPTLRVTDEAVLFRAAWMMDQVALDPSNGKLLWTNNAGFKWGRSLRGFPLDGKLHDWGVYDLRTGKMLSEAKVPSHGCGPSMAVGDLIVTAFGGVHRMDGQMLRAPDLKPACDLGVVVADGIALSPPPLCRCNLMLQGGRAFTSAGQIDPNSPGDKTTRLVRGPAFGKSTPASVKATDADWPTYRHDTVRSGATPVRLPIESPVILWKWSPPLKGAFPALPAGGRILKSYDDSPEWLPTQAVSVDKRAYFAGADGVIRCLDVGSGKLRWQFPVGARLLAPPTVDSGHVFAGADNGWLYWLRSSDGGLVWRFRLAPTDRRIMWYGHLASTWPVTGGALVRDGVVYAVAGFHRGNGVHAVALNAANGRVLWENHEAGKAPLGGANFGHIALDNSRLWFCAGTAGPGSFDLKTGESTLMGNVQFASTGRRGMDISILGEGRVLFGGRRLAYTFQQWVATEKSIGYTVYNADTPLEKGKRVCVGADVSTESLFAPLFDDDILIMGNDYKSRGGRNGEIAAYARAEFLARVDKGGEPLRKFLKKNAPWYFSTLVRGKEKQLPDGPQWSGVKLDAITGLLTPNAILLACLEGLKAVGKNGEWFLAAVSRKDGQTLWTAPLPGRPAWNGLSMTRDGRILVSLADGSVICMGAGD